MKMNPAAIALFFVALCVCLLSAASTPFAAERRRQSRADGAEEDSGIFVPLGKIARQVREHLSSRTVREPVFRYVHRIQRDERALRRAYQVVAPRRQKHLQGWETPHLRRQ